MLLLNLDKTSNRVVCSQEFLARNEAQKVLEKNKKEFEAVITALYYIFRPRNIYWNKSLQERIRIVNEDHLKAFHTSWEQLSKLNGVKALTDLYVDLSTTINDRADANIRNDFEELINALNEVPTKVEVEIPAEVDVLCDDGKVRRVKKAVRVFVPTFEQKAELWGQYEKFSKILKNIQTALKVEAEERLQNGDADEIYPWDNVKKNQIT